ncbi:hypothetical protein OG474_44950 [Kribbella sp. NBC_01505]|uniref:hypothetical protein n=1 Tax=Kribbella sp. NBC_01505 TaxID=2903580 RepID=UPI00386A3023
MSEAEVDAVAGALRDDAMPGSAYSLIHILGRAQAVRHRELVAGFLQSPGDPDLARIALKSLCSYWGLTAEYLPQVIEFVRGVEWDEEPCSVRPIAMSVLGAHLTDHPDPALTRLLLDVAAESGSAGSEGDRR